MRRSGLVFATAITAAAVVPTPRCLGQEAGPGAADPAEAPAVQAARSPLQEPSAFPISWELDFTHSDLRRIAVEVPGSVAPQVFWYMTYVATNNTEQEQMFLPTFDLVTADGQSIRSNRETSAKVFEDIARRENNSLLRRHDQLMGPIRQGEDQAKYGVAIWPQPASGMTTVGVYISGLSGEQVTLTDSTGQPMTDSRGNPIILRKTRQVDFTIRGDGLFGDFTIARTATRAIMR